MWYNDWFGDWFGGWFDGSEGEEEHVNLFGGLPEEEEVIVGSSTRDFRYYTNYESIEEEEDYDEDEEILIMCQAFLVCHT